MSDERFEKMLNGDVVCIEEGLVSDCVTERINALFTIVKKGIKKPEIVHMIETLCEDFERVYPQNPDMTVSNYAISALDVLGIKNYDGDDLFVKKLIAIRLGV